MRHPMGLNQYGKSGIRLAVVDRSGPVHDLVDLEVEVRLRGDFDAAHVNGDNSAVLPTDTMRGTCHALARDGIAGVAAYGLRLVDRFLAASPATREVAVWLTRYRWRHVEVDGTPHPHAFQPSPGGSPTWTVTRRRGAAPVLTGGIVGARLLKTTGSAFSGFLRDELTTLPETRERVMATTIEAWWGPAGAGASDGMDALTSMDALADAVPTTFTTAFATHDDSESVQHTLHVMGSAVMDAHPEVGWIRFRLPNEHHIVSDLSPYGRDNPGVVHLVADRPFGVIEGVVARDGVDPAVPW